MIYVKSYNNLIKLFLTERIHLLLIAVCRHQTTAYSPSWRAEEIQGWRVHQQYSVHVLDLHLRFYKLLLIEEICSCETILSHHEHTVHGIHVQINCTIVDRDKNLDSQITFQCFNI